MVITRQNIISILSGIATAFLTTKALQFLNELSRSTDLIYDIYKIDQDSKSTRIDIIVSNYTNEVISLQPVNVKIFTPSSDSQAIEQPVNYTTIRIAPGAIQVFKDIVIDQVINMDGPIYIEVAAVINGRNKKLKPFQEFQGLGVYDRESELIYKELLNV